MSKPVSSSKVLVVIQFWNGDKAQAMKLARLLADLEDSHSTEADVLFVCRFDSSQDPATVKYVSRRFNTYTLTSRRRGVGWPTGCNSLFFGGLEWVYHKMAAGQIPHYQAIFILGSDSAPLVRDWTTPLLSAWKHANRKTPVYMAGAMGEAGGRMHINGDCVLLSTNLKFLKWLAVTVGDVNVSAGWDWFLSDEFARWGWANIPSIKSLWRKATFSIEEWNVFTSGGVIWIHGIKDDSLLEIARKKLCQTKL